MDRLSRLRNQPERKFKIPRERFMYQEQAYDLLE
jgi:hypothetical protein